LNILQQRFVFNLNTMHICTVYVYFQKAPDVFILRYLIFVLI